MLQRTRCVDADIIDGFRTVPVANVSDVMERVWSAPASIRPIHDGTPMCGPAVTVRAAPGDNLLVHKALDVAEPGDVIVVDAGGDLTNSILGEMMITHAIARRLGGIVIFGAIRDFDTLKTWSFPVFAAGVTHRGPYKNGPGELNVPIALGSMVIEPGDVVLGDGDGVITVPFVDANSILEAAQKKHAKELAHMTDLQNGVADRDWIDAKLRSLGAKF
ncbi:RraA family protein [Falsirhodobacter xinxiangensis]|uniref:RraA family protein n=1 Tax=Falsirhodobacter xinxiangensis TaxID=2530049 RepID=UPI001FE4CC4A|nr:RraA family protein [Rhodobacter xinxiangensis]